MEREGGPEFWRCSLRWRVSYQGLGDPTLFSGLTPSLIFRSPPTTCNSPCLPIPPPRPVYPCRTYCRLSFYGTPTPSPTANTAHCPECCVVASPGVPPLPSEALSALTNRPPRSILYNYPACITKVAAKLFPPPREIAPFNPLLANSEPVRLTLFLSSRAPLARTRLIGVVFRPVVLAVSALIRASFPRICAFSH